jgi:hypothetical protein
MHHPDAAHSKKDYPINTCVWGNVRKRNKEKWGRIYFSLQRQKKYRNTSLIV